MEPTDAEDLTYCFLCRSCKFHKINTEHQSEICKDSMFSELKRNCIDPYEYTLDEQCKLYKNYVMDITPDIIKAANESTTKWNAVMSAMGENCGFCDLQREKSGKCDIDPAVCGICHNKKHESLFHKVREGTELMRDYMIYVATKNYTEVHKIINYRIPSYLGVKKDIYDAKIEDLETRLKKWKPIAEEVTNKLNEICIIIEEGK